MKDIMPTLENSPENFKKTPIEIKEPDHIHGLEIIFDETDTKLVTAYNVAINEICNKENNLGMFHQTGKGNDAGYHAWEVLGSAANTQKLSGLFSLIHQRAEEIYLRFKELNFF
jgi:hypothetical protein